MSPAWHAESKCFTLQHHWMQACGEVYAMHAARLPQQAVLSMLDMLQGMSSHARSIDSDVTARHALAAAQARDQVCMAPCPSDRLRYCCMRMLWVCIRYIRVSGRAWQGLNHCVILSVLQHSALARQSYACDMLAYVDIA